MNIIEAVSLLENDIDGESDYSKTIIFSKSLQKYLVNSKYGICQCGNDWPYAYLPKTEDFKATDWEISKHD